MRFGTDEELWVVVDPNPESTLGDICFSASLRSLELQFRGGLSCAENPTLFTDREEALVEARARLVARHAAEAIAGSRDGLEDADRVQVLDAEGKVIFSAFIGKVRP